MSWLDDADIPLEPDRNIRHLRIQGLSHEEYVRVRKALEAIGMSDVMIVEPEWFPSSGIWYVRYYKGGRSSTLVAKKLRDLPKAIRAAAINPMAEFISQIITKFWDEQRELAKTNLNHGYSASDMGKYLAAALTHKIRVEAEEDFTQSLKGLPRDDNEHRPPKL